MAMNFFTAKHELIALAISTLGGTYGGVCVHAFQIWEGRQISGQCSSAVESDLRDSGRIPPGSGDSYRHSGGFSDSFSSHRELPR
ncbi:hypothetical protein Plhal304r1_c071g0160171 [Plasmopara halstedii]